MTGWDWRVQKAQPSQVIVVRSRAIDPSVRKIAQALAQNGYIVNLLLWAREGASKTDDGGNGYTTSRFNLKAPYYRPSLLFYIPLWWLYEFLFLLRSQVKIIHACDLDTVLPAILVKIIKRTKLCYTIYDFYADILPRKTPGIIKKLVATIEKSALRFVDVLFLVDSSRYEQVRGAKIKRVEYIYNSPEDYLGSKELKKPVSTINVFYAGYLDKSRGLEAITNVIGKLDSVNFTIAGTGPGKDIIERHSTKRHNLKYLGQIPYEEVIANSLNADILLAFYDPRIPGNRYASPNKLFEAMMCAKPIIVNDDTTASRIVAQENCGLVVPYGDVEAISEAIVKLINDPELCHRLGENGRKAYETRYSWEIMKNRLINAYHDITTVLPG